MAATDNKHPKQVTDGNGTVWKPTPAPADWPDSVTHRYLNQVGATVDIVRGPDGVYARCTGCPAYHDDPTTYPDTAHAWAQDHATHCRALPRPAHT